MKNNEIAKERAYRGIYHIMSSSYYGVSSNQSGNMPQKKEFESTRRLMRDLHTKTYPHLYAGNEKRDTRVTLFHLLVIIEVTYSIIATGIAIYLTLS